MEFIKGFKLPKEHGDRLFKLKQKTGVSTAEWWFENSHVPDGIGCRIGPLLRQPKPGAPGRVPE